jgi:hypothetical protein
LESANQAFGVGGVFWAECFPVWPSTPDTVEPPYKLAMIGAFTCGGYEVDWRRHLSDNGGIYAGFSGTVGLCDIGYGACRKVIKNPGGEIVTIPDRE